MPTLSMVNNFCCFRRTCTCTFCVHHKFFHKTHFNSCTHCHRLLVKAFTAFMATTSIERFGQQLSGKLCEVNQNSVKHFADCKPPFLFIAFNNLLHFVNRLSYFKYSRSIEVESIPFEPGSPYLG